MAKLDGRSTKGRIRITGVPALKTRMRRLERKVETTIRNRATSRGINVITRAIRKAAPVGKKKKAETKPTIKQSIGQARVKTKGKLVGYKAGINVGRGASKRSPHAHLVALGTTLRATKKTGANRGRMPKNDFVRQAYRRFRSEANRVARRTFLEILERETRKLGLGGQ